VEVWDIARIKAAVDGLKAARRSQSLPDRLRHVADGGCTPTQN